MNTNELTFENLGQEIENREDYSLFNNGVVLNDDLLSILEILTDHSLYIEAIYNQVENLKNNSFYSSQIFNDYNSQNDYYDLASQMDMFLEKTEENVVEYHQNYSGKVLEGAALVTSLVQPELTAPVTSLKAVNDGIFNLILMGDIKKEEANIEKLSKEFNILPSHMKEAFDIYKQYSDDVKQLKYKQNELLECIDYTEESKNILSKMHEEGMPGLLEAGNKEDIDRAEAFYKNGMNDYNNTIKKRKGELEEINTKLEEVYRERDLEILFALNSGYYVYDDEGNATIPQNNINWSNISISSQTPPGNGMGQNVILSQEEMDFLIERVLEAVKTLNFEPTIEITQITEDEMSEEEILSVVKNYLDTSLQRKSLAEMP